MKTITVNPKILRVITSDYRRHVVESGHVAGVLSGAELTGKAKQYGASYARSRTVVAAALEYHYDIRNRLIVHPESRRNVRVWTDADGEPVRVRLSHVNDLAED